jgi:hypothetical protein
MNMQYARMVFAHEQAHRDRVNTQSPDPHRARKIPHTDVAIVRVAERI